MHSLKEFHGHPFSPTFNCWGCLNRETVLMLPGSVFQRVVLNVWGEVGHLSKGEDEVNTLIVYVFIYTASVSLSVSHLWFKQKCTEKHNCAAWRMHNVVAHHENLKCLNTSAIHRAKRKNGALGVCHAEVLNSSSFKKRCKANKLGQFHTEHLTCFSEAVKPFTEQNLAGKRLTEPRVCSPVSGVFIADPKCSEQHSKVMAHAEFYMRSKLKSSVLFGSHTVQPWALWLNKSQRGSRSTLKYHCWVSQTEAAGACLPSVHVSCSVCAGLAPGFRPEQWIELITDLCAIITQAACEGCDLSF